MAAASDMEQFLLQYFKKTSDYEEDYLAVVIGCALDSLR